MVSVADSVMVGKLGTLPLAAVALANSIFVIFMVFGVGVTFGITPLVANADGQGKTQLPTRLLQQGLIVYTSLAFLLLLLLLAVLPLMPYFGQDPALIPITRPYFLVLSASIIPLMLFMTFKQFAEGFSDTRAAMVISVGSNLLNVLLNYLLIFGAWGFPEMGLIGAGWATLIARTLMFVIMAIYVLNKWPLIRITKRIRRVVIKKLLSIGIPTGLQSIFEVGAFAVAALFAGMLSAEALAAHQIAINLASISYMAATGLGAAAAVRVSNQLGRRDVINLRRAAQSLFSLTIGLMVITGVVLLLFRSELAALYTNDPMVTALAAKMLMVAVVFQLSDGLQAVGLGALRGFTDVKIPTIITFLAYWMFTIPLAYMLSQYTPSGALGIWYALAGGLTISAALLLWRFRRLLNQAFIASPIDP
jgi:MATE family multidrug resistance protein